MLVIEYVGLVGGCITTFAGIPQIIYIIKTERTNDLNWYMLIFWIIGLSCSTSFGIITKQPSIYVSTSCSLFMSTLMLLLKIKFEILNKRLDNVEFNKIVDIE